MLVVIAIVGVVVLGSIALFAASVLDGRPQRWGLGFAVLAAVLYVVYYSDVLLPGSFTAARDVVRPLGAFGDGDRSFGSSIGVALALIPMFVIQTAIFLRITVDTAGGHVSDRIANFMSGVTAVILLGAIVISASHGGYVMVAVYVACTGIAYITATSLQDHRAPGGCRRPVRRGPRRWARVRARGPVRHARRVDHLVRRSSSGQARRLDQQPAGCPRSPARRAAPPAAVPERGPRRHALAGGHATLQPRSRSPQIRTAYHCDP